MKTIAIAIFLLAFNNLNAQESNFSIVKIGDKYSQEQLITSMSGADWCGYYFLNEKHQLKFDDGSIVEFKSASEIDGLDHSCVGQPYEDDKTYSIHSTGRIMIRVDKIESSKAGGSSK